MNKFFDEELVEQYFPEVGELMTPPMLIWKLPQGKENKIEEVCGSGDYFGSLKKDGYAYIATKTQNHFYLFSRNISKTNGLLNDKAKNVPHIEEALNCLPPKTMIVFEIYYPGKTSKAVTEIMGCLPQEAIKRQKIKGLIHAYAHDLIYYNGVDLRDVGALERYQLLEAIWKKHKFSSFDFLELAQPIFDNIYEIAMKAISNGEEGVVLRKKDAPYEGDKRPAWSTIKIKKNDTIDLICMGFCPATKEYTGKDIEQWPYWESKEVFSEKEIIYNKTDTCQYGKEGWYPITKPYYMGWIGAIEIGAYNKKGELIKLGTVSSGLTDEDKINIKKNPNNYLNKVVSLSCMSIDTKEKTLRHPVFKFWRFDKDAMKCAIGEIFNK